MSKKDVRKERRRENKLMKIIIGSTIAMGIGIGVIFYNCPRSAEQIGLVEYHGTSKGKVMRIERCFSNVEKYWVESERGIEYPAEVSKDQKTIYINGEDFPIVQE